MKKLLTVLSLVFFACSFLMLFYLFQNWHIAFINYLYEISIFMPLVMNGVSILLASLGLRGMTRKTIIYLNVLVIIVFSIFFLIALYGFPEP